MKENKKLVINHILRQVKWELFNVRRAARSISRNALKILALMLLFGIKRHKKIKSIHLNYADTKKRTFEEISISNILKDIDVNQCIC